MDALCKRFRIDNSKRVQHTALVDCDLLSKVYINLIDQKEPRLDFQNNDYDNRKSKSLDVSYFKKVVIPTKEEIKNMKNISKKLKKNYFS